jgi:AmmeMemoRadiSam system protein B
LAQNGTPDALVLIGPNHHGYGQRMAVATHGSWRTPLGELEIDQGLARELLSLCPGLADDTIAHRAEHSLEVQLPFIQFVYGNAVRIVPITLYTIDFEDIHSLGDAVGRALAGKNVAIVASTDMTHYEAEQVAKAKDSAALNAILRLDERELVATVRKLIVTMCGLGPVVTMMVAAKRLGATRGVLNAYYSSGAITGEQDEVVGYASVSLFR